MDFKPIEGLDETDNRILAILSDDARAGYSYIGKKVGISRVAVKNRIDSLERRGFIGGYRTLINRTAAPGTISFFMDIEVELDHYTEILDYLASFKSCKQIYGCTSANRIHVTGYAPDVETLGRFVTALCKDPGGINRITYQVITATYKDSDGGIEYVRHSENEYLERPAGESKPE